MHKGYRQELHNTLGFTGPILVVMLAVPVLGTGKCIAECRVLMPALLPQTAQLAVRW